MANLQLLNNVEHQNLRVITKNSTEFGDDVGGCLVFPEEFLAAHREYPLLLQKDPETGSFQFIALFGFQKNENLFLTDAGWSARYIPALMRREPFYIGFQEDKTNNASATPVIHVDIDSPRISEDGERLFLENGGYTPFLESLKVTLLQIHEGIATARAFLAVLLKHNLIEQFTLDIEFNDGAKLKTDSYYTISQDQLMKLEDPVVAELHRSGALQLTYMMLASSGNIKHLVDTRNRMR